MPAELKEKVAHVLAEQIGPALQMDGTEMEVVDVSDGVVQLRLRGACGTCPGTVMTLIMGIEQELRQLVPEVKYLETVP
jgi:Fe-S cluster biogenesis protein NfuA